MNGRKYCRLCVNTKIGGGYNVLRIKPLITPREVWSRYGFPLVGKETAMKIHRIRTNPDNASCKHWLSDLKADGSVNKFVLPHKWRWLIDEKFDTNNVCCDKLKKEPFHRFEKETGRYPILGIMADESQQRKMRWIRNGGCNVWEGKIASMPLSIWTEKNIFDYIERYNVLIPEIYYKGMDRTGCTACNFGCTKKGDNRYDILYDLHPKYYNMVMNFTNNGVTLREAVGKVLAVNGMTLPDERENTLFTDEEFEE